MPTLVPSRRRGKLERAARTARNLTLARAALSLVQTKLVGRLPGVRRKRRVTPARAAILGGGLAAFAGLARTRRKGARTDVPPPPPAAAATTTPPPPTPANYDAAGPPANTATPLPAVTDPVDPVIGIDEEAEVAAAAAEAAGIGGPAPEYASSLDAGELADAPEAALLEAGGGESEGQEQAEADLADLATTGYGPGAGKTDAERQIEEAIEQASNPASGETVDPDVPPGTGN